MEVGTTATILKNQSQPTPNSAITPTLATSASSAE
jgi:hypothetical protein